MIQGRRFDRAFSRRAFLGALGVAAASPFVPLLNASGQEVTAPKRLVLFFTPHGTIFDDWRPTGTERDFSFGRILAPLERHKRKLVILDGVQNVHGDDATAHTEGMVHLWTGCKMADRPPEERYAWATGPSVDQVVAATVGGDTSFRSIELGVDPGGTWQGARPIYAASEQPVDPEWDPRSAFDRIFANNDARVVKERKSSIDLVQKELQALMPRLAKADRHKVESHLQAISDIERRFDRVINCQATPLDPGVERTLPNQLEQHMDILSMAFACDLTRVASLQWTFADNDGHAYDWLGISEGHHDLSHEGDQNLDAREKLVSIYTWYSEQFARLLDKLDAIQEADGTTALDNTMIVWGSELGTGNTHSPSPTPFIVAGGAGGAYETGRYLKYDTLVDSSRLLVTICQAMGQRDVKTFGNLDTGSGPLPRFFA